MKRQELNKPVHQPVLLDEVFGFLQLRPGEVYLDLTAGFGGHAQAAKQAIRSEANLVLVDRDVEACGFLRTHFKDARIINEDFVSAAKLLISEGKMFDAICVDLGVSSAQLDRQERGFSFAGDGPLDMRMDTRQRLTAADIVNGYSEEQLADLIFQKGGERRSRQIARAIVARRPLATTAQLADAVKSQFRHYQRIHPATRTFQALRMEVNQELEQLAQLLPLLPKLLKNSGRLAIISFHSLEDSLVKRYFRQSDRDGEIEQLTKKVIKPATQETTTNPRSRSARLRAARKK